MPKIHKLIPYFQTTRYRVQAMIDLAKIKPGELAADLGSGDGRILIALAQTGARAHGYELDDNLIDVSKDLIRQARCDEKIVIHKNNFWEVDLSEYTVITVYGMPDVMDALEEKLQKELKPGARVLSNYYAFPTWKEKRKKDNIFLYIK